MTVLSAFEVTEQSGLGYRATKTLAGAGIATELRDLPSSISVLNREFMDDLMVTNIEELSKFFVSGEFEPAPEASISSGAAVRMRGIPTGNLRDGIYHPAILDSHAIDRVGLISYGAAAGDADKVFEAALEAGAEDVTSSEEGHEIWTAQGDLHEVVKALEPVLGEAEGAKLAWRPQTMVEVSEADAATLFKLIDALDDDDDVQTVWGNYEVSDAVMAKLG